MGWRSKPESGRADRDPIENILGRSVVIRGDLTAEGAFRIDGTIEGSVESRAAVVVGESGVVRGDVRGADVVIAGQVHGNVTCTGHLEILAKGMVEGDIDAQSMRIETGGVVRGTSHMGEHAPPARARGTADGDEKASEVGPAGELSPAA